MSSFSVDIGSTSCDSVKSAVLAFYSTFYRYDASGLYSQIIPDEAK